jgi:pyoverdine/dityrosine biosynthesis protein Dit1
MTLSYEKNSSFSPKINDILDEHIQIAIHDIFMDCFETPSEELGKVLPGEDDYKDFYESNLKFWEAREEYKKCSKLKKMYEKNCIKKNDK